MEKEYYKEYYELERKHWWFAAREKIIYSQLEKIVKPKVSLHNKIKILNIGCGTGRSTEYLMNFGDVTSIEYDKFCIAFTQEKTGLNILHGSITELPFEVQTFNIVCAFDVVEHVQDHELAIKEMKRICKSNGNILITVPAFMSLWSHHDEVNHHFRRYELKEIKNLFETIGEHGTELFSSYFNFFLFTPIWVFRKISMKFNLQNTKGSGSDFGSFNPGVLNIILYHLMKTENFFLKHGIKFRFGVSILFSWQKD